MTISRRDLLLTGAATTGAITVLPWLAHSAAHAGHTFQTASGSLVVHPVSHASFVMETPAGTIYVDPVGDAAAYGGFPAPDLVLITHEHGDHYNVDVLNAIRGGAPMITNPAVSGMLPEGLAAGTQALANGEGTSWNGTEIAAIPAYNITQERLNFHPQGRDNGYVLTVDGFRVYVSGDTEDIPEMRALQGIDLAFVCMNLPFTMDAAAAASAVAEFGPRYVYPYHYRGREGGTQDPAMFAELVGDATEVRLGEWY